MRTEPTTEGRERSDFIREIVAEVGFPRDLVTPDALLVIDLGMDSLDRVELQVRLEEEFGISVSDEARGSWVTVEDIYRSVENLTTNAEEVRGDG